MKGRWHIVVISACLGIYVAVFSLAWWLLFIIIPLIVYCLLQRSKGRIYLIVIVASFLIFYFYTDIYNKNNATTLSINHSTFKGSITSLPVIDGDRISFQMKLSSNEKLQVFYYIPTKENQNELRNLKVGMTCVLQGELRIPSQPTNFYAFDYQKYLYLERIHWVLNPRSINMSNCSPGSNHPFIWVKQYRQDGIAFIEKIMPAELKGIMAALIFGHRNMVEEDVLSAYQSLGVIHVLAVSGLHVGLLVGALFYLLIRLGITRERVYEILLVILPVYIILAGAAPSVIRASFMAMTVLLCLRIKKKINPIDGISFIFIIYLFISPYALFQLGFQLSFLISYSLILSGQTIFSELNGYLKPLFAVTLQSQLFSLPLILFHFYEFSLLSLPLNLVYIPFISIIILPAVFLLLLIVFLIPSLGIPLANFFNVIILFAHEKLIYLEHLSWGSITVGKITEIEGALILIVIMFGCYSYEKRNRLKDMVLPFGLFAIIIVSSMLAPYIQSRGEVTIIDVGQGDSILIELPYRKKVYLIDTGGLVTFGRDEEWRKRRSEFDVGKDVVTPYLKAKGITKINKLILSHGHYDHMGGAFALVDEFEISEVFYSNGAIERDFEVELLKKLKKGGSKITFVQEGLKWREGDEQFYILSPKGHEEGLNQRSIVILARLGGFNWLFTGDLEEDGEARLVRDYPNLDVDILKAGHHGSRTSSSPSFIDHIQPKAVIISVGRNNRFNHPHSEVVNIFQERNIRIYRTDEYGAIQFQFSKNGYRVDYMMESKKGLSK